MVYLPGHLKFSQPLVDAVAVRTLRCRCWSVIGRDSVQVLVYHVVYHVVTHLVTPSNQYNNYYNNILCNDTWAVMERTLRHLISSQLNSAELRREGTQFAVAATTQNHHKYDVYDGSD